MDATEGWTDGLESASTIGGIGRGLGPAESSELGVGSGICLGKKNQFLFKLCFSKRWHSKKTFEYSCTVHLDMLESYFLFDIDPGGIGGTGILGNDRRERKLELFLLHLDFDRR